MTGAGIENRPSAQGEHTVVLQQRGCDSGPLEAPKVVLALVDEDVAHRLAGDLFDIPVGVPKADSEGAGQYPSDR
jgi:hypothetical protein